MQSVDGCVLSTYDKVQYLRVQYSKHTFYIPFSFTESMLVFLWLPSVSDREHKGLNT